MDRVLLARHAESTFSVDGLTNGDPRVEGGLTGRGRDQAHRLGELLADTPIDLAVVSEFQRARETADLALAGRDVPRLVLAELNDIRFGDFEGRLLANYRAWARAHRPDDAVPGGGESRVAAVRRFVAGYRGILQRPERTILVVAHSLPLRYVLDAAAGRAPGPAVEQLAYAEPLALEAAALATAVELLQAWTRAPAWS